MDQHKIAKICHELNMNYCRAIGDYSHLPWEHTPQSQKDSILKGVDFIVKHPDSTPKGSHEAWFKFKAEEGWKYGEEKDTLLKEHPCMVPYDQLPIEQRIKDELFQNTVKTLLKLGTSI